MAQVKKETNTTNDLHKGYNEKNPGQPQGAFVAGTMKKKDVQVDKEAVGKLEKRKTNLTTKK